MVATLNKGLHIYFKYNKKLGSMGRFKLNGTNVGWDMLNDNRQTEQLLPSIDINNNKKYKWVVKPTGDNIIYQCQKRLEDYIILLHH